MAKIYGNNVTFPANSEFGDYSLFGDHCHFGIGCKFGEGCTFGKWNFFDSECHVGKNSIIGDMSLIRSDCVIDGGTKIGDDATFEEGIVWNDNVITPGIGEIKTGTYHLMVDYIIDELDIEVQMISNYDENDNERDMTITGITECIRNYDNYQRNNLTIHNTYSDNVIDSHKVETIYSDTLHMTLIFHNLYNKNGDIVFRTITGFYHGAPDDVSTKKFDGELMAVYDL